jgi:hypothetical protein
MQGISLGKDVEHPGDAGDVHIGELDHHILDQRHAPYRARKTARRKCHIAQRLDPGEIFQERNAR